MAVACVSSQLLSCTSEYENKFIDLIAVNRNLWDHKDPLYTKNVLRRNTFQAISDVLRGTWPHAQQLFTTGKN